MSATYLAPALVSRFFDNNGNPLIKGQVFTYQAGTSTPAPTYTDSTGGTPNANPIILNARGEANIWIPPNVGYKFVVEDSLGNTIQTIDQVTNAALISLYGGVDTGIANQYVINFASPLPANTNGQVIYWLPSNSNTGPSSINVNGAGPQPILNPNGSTLGANQILAGQFVSIISINGTWQLYGGSGTGVNVGTFGQEAAIPSAATTDLGSVPAHVAAITGTTTITSFGASAQVVAPIYVVRFTASLLLTNSASLMLPGANNITTAIGDALLAEYLGSGVWKVLIYQPAAPSAQASAVKSADTAITSNATLTADPDLSVSLFTGQYTYELFMLFDSVAAGAGFKFQSNGTATDSRSTSPAVADGLVNAAAYGPKLESFVGNTISYATVGTAADSNGVLYKGSLLVNTAGTFGIQWAQVVSTASNTTVRAGSYLTVRMLAQKGGVAPVQHIFSTAGTNTETILAGYTTLIIECWGGSGGGGQKFTNVGQFSGGGGGGSAGYCRTSITITGLGGDTLNYTVGAAGPFDSAGFQSQVSSGTLTITTMTATGGGAGGNAPGLGSGGVGGTAGTGTGGTVVNSSGNNGSPGLNDGGGGTGGAGGAGIAGIYAGGAAGAVGAGIGTPNLAGGAGVVVFAYIP